jgi:hypothetical protein
VLLLADLAEPVTSNAYRGSIVFAHELATALYSYQETGQLEVHLVARRGSSRQIPLISLDPSELGPVTEGSLGEFARTEALYASLILSGMLSDYQIIHCLAPLIVPLHLLTSNGIPVLQSILAGSSHPACQLPPLLAPVQFLRQVAVLPHFASGAKILPTGINLNVYRPSPAASRKFIVQVGSDEVFDNDVAQLSRFLRVAIRKIQSGNPVSLLQNALAVLCHSGDEPLTTWMWALRALACGTPVVAFGDPCPLDFLAEPLGIVAKPGNHRRLARKIELLSNNSDAAGLRRRLALARHGHRAMAASYREAYIEMLEGALNASFLRGRR